MKKWLKVILGGVVVVILLFAIDLICIFAINKPLFAIKEDNGDSVNLVYRGLFYDTYNCHEYSEPQIKAKGTKFACVVNETENNTLRLNLFDKDYIVKVGINTYAQNDNYFEYEDKNTIEKIYNIFSGLETDVASKTYNPENPEEMYSVVFFNEESMLIESDNDIFKANVEVYRKNGKYYAEQRYNGIYEITEEDFNIIKSYVK